MVQVVVPTVVLYFVPHVAVLYLAVVQLSVEFQRALLFVLEFVLVVVLEFVLEFVPEFAPEFVALLEIVEGLLPLLSPPREGDDPTGRPEGPHLCL